VSRTVFLGTSDFAATVLRGLASSPQRPLLAVTPPPRRRGRGRRQSAVPAALAAAELGIEVLETADVNEPGPIEEIGAARPDVVCVCAFGQLIREPLLSEHLMLNLHPSLLPRWRGAAPIERAIMAGDEVTGNCVIRLVEELDAGPVGLREEMEIAEAENYGHLAARLAESGARLLTRALDLAQGGGIEFTEQPAEGITYAEKVDSSERLIDPSRPAAELARQVRALTPHIGAHLEAPAGGESLGVRRARAESGDLGAGVIETADDALLLGCAEGVLRIEEVQAPGSRPMEVAAYLRGRRPPDRARIP